MKKINSNILYLITLVGLFILTLIPTYAHHGSLLVDCGREAYYPTQVLLGKVLYKDIFNIYGPFSYLLNALLFKMFGINLNVLYLSGCFCAFSILCLTYLIAKRFLSKFLTFSICLLTIVVGVLNTNIFNFIFPYSYAMLYGTVAVLISIYFLLKYEESPENNLYLYLSGFFAGIGAANKQEFLPYYLVIFYAAYKIKSLNFKQYGLLLSSMLFIPTLCFSILFLHGLRINDLVSALFTLNKMMHAKTLAYYYQHVGVFFHKKVIFLLTKSFLLTIFLLAFFFFSATRKNKVLSAFLVLLSSLLIFYNTNPMSFIFLPILISLMFVLNLKTLKNNTKLMILALSSILLNLKIYWGLLLFCYGEYFVNLSLIAIFALILYKFKNKNINQKFIAAFIILTSISLSLFTLSSSIINKKTFPIHSSHGTLYPDNELFKPSEALIKYIQTKTKKTDTIVILPEGQMINFLTDRKSDNIYGSLIALYIETFGEDKIIEHFKQTKPEYIIFNNQEHKEYYFKYICNDYAQAFCSFVAQNYSQKKVIDDGFRYLIFRRKDK